MTTSTTGIAEAPIAAPRNDWRLLLAVFLLVGIIESQAFGHFSAFTPLYLQELHVPADQISLWTGILQSLGFVIGLPLLPFWGVWAQRYGRKLIIVRSAFIEAVLFGLAALSPNIWVFAGARFLTGFIFGNTGIMFAMLAESAPRPRMGQAIGLVSAAAPVGIAIGPFFGGLIAQGPGLRALLGIDAGLSLLAALLLVLAIREPRMSSATPSTSSTWGQLRGTLAAIRVTPGVASLFVLYFLAFVGYSLTTPFVSLVIQRLYHGDPGQLPATIGASLTVAGVAMAVTSPLWGRAGDALGRWNIFPLGLGGLAIALGIEAWAPNLLTMRSGVVLGGLVFGGIGTTFTALLAYLAPDDQRTSILNISLLPSQLSWFLGPLIGSGLALITLAMPFAVGAAMLAVACLWAVVLARRRSTGS